MIAKAFQLSRTRGLVPLELDQLGAPRTGEGEGEAREWLDLKGATPEELEGWLDRLGVEGLSRRLCLEDRDRPGFYPLANELLVIVPVFSTLDAERELDHLTLLCRERWLLTIHGGPILGAGQIEDLLDAETWLANHTPTGLVTTLLFELSAMSLRKVSDLRASILELELRMDRDPDSVEADELFSLRSELSSFGAANSDRLPCLEALIATDKPHFRVSEAPESLHCALANTQSVERSLLWLDQRVSALRSGLDMRAQERANHRLGTLTILSAIFMPLTLLAGIWGMNFEQMPELEFALGYPAALALMALVAVAMFRYFRRGGWFG